MFSKVAFVTTYHGKWNWPFLDIFLTKKNSGNTKIERNVQGNESGEKDEETVLDTIFQLSFKVSDIFPLQPVEVFLMNTSLI